MRLNTLKRAAGAKKAAKRVARGIGCGSGKTAGRGHKGLKSRSGGAPAPGFEGGQMPLQRRLPKVGFSSRKKRHADEIRLSELSKVEGDTVDMDTLRAANLIGQVITRVKIIASGELARPVTVKGLAVTAGARKAIEAAGGKVED